MSPAPDPFGFAADLLDPPPPEYHGDLEGFITKRLRGFLWSTPEQIVASVGEHYRTAVPACFASSKTWVAARIAVAWIATNLPALPPGPRVVTTAATFRQVRALLWGEMGDAYSMAPDLPGRLKQTEWHARVGGVERLVAFGVATKEPNRIQGTHGEPVLVIIDEADGVPEPIWDAIDGLVLNPDQDRILAIGNPWDPSGRFAQVCKPDSGWNVIRIPASATPNFTGEDVPEQLNRILITKAWVADKVKRWGRDDPRFVSKVLAHFPEDAEGTLVHQAWLDEAQTRKLRNALPIELAVDVGGDTGGDESVIGLRRGHKFRVLWTSRHHDTQEIANQTVFFIKETGASVAKVDAIGIGKGVFDRLRKLHQPVAAFIASAKPRDSDYENARAEAAWGVRERFEADDIDIDPDDDELAGQCLIRWKPNSRGKIQLESKDDYARRKKGTSPDRFDTMAMAFYPMTAARLGSQQEIGQKSIMGDVANLEELGDVMAEDW